MMKAWRLRPVGRSGNPALISGLAAVLWLPLLGLAQLNDTGVDQYRDWSSFTPSEPADFPGQDPSYGRDADAAAGRLLKVGGGAKGRGACTSTTASTTATVKTAPSMFVWFAADSPLIISP